MAGSEDVCAGDSTSGAAPVLTPAQLAEAAPDVLIFALCGLSLERSERAARAVAERLAAGNGPWARLPAVRTGRVAGGLVGLACMLACLLPPGLCCQATAAPGSPGRAYASVPPPPSPIPSTVVDGERVFSRPGPLLAPSMEALVEILHPEAQRSHEGRLWRPLAQP